MKKIITIKMERSCCICSGMDGEEGKTYRITPAQAKFVLTHGPAPSYRSAVIVPDYEEPEGQEGTEGEGQEGTEGQPSLNLEDAPTWDDIKAEAKALELPIKGGREEMLGAIAEAKAKA